MRRREALLAMGAGITTGLPAALRTDKLDEAAEMIAKAAGQGVLRAASLHVRQGSRTFRRAFGEARTPEAVFLLASITKPMTATGLMVLADRGELALSDPVRKFIPEFSDGDRRKITMRHLLTHTSGLPDMLPENVALRRRQAPLEEFVERAIRTPLLFEPGAKVSYQSMGILLAAEAAQRITGQPFREFLAKEVYGPLGMDRTALGLGRFRIEDTMLCQVDEAPGVYGGGEDSSSWNWNSPYWRNLAAPWGGAHSAGSDVAKFLSHFLAPDGRVLQAETARAMIVNQNEGLDRPWGIGFSVLSGGFGRGCSPAVFGHTGSTGTIAWADPAKNLSFVLLTTWPAAASDKPLREPVSDLVSEAA